MKLCIISFTKQGRLLSESIARAVGEAGQMEIELYTKHSTDEIDEHQVKFVQTALGHWAGEQMREKKALLFIGACGIAVRAIAPHLTDKLHDSPVLVMDEKGRHVIPILSGHVGGANLLAVYLAKKTGAEPVITTATDLEKKFAVDMFAEKNGLSIRNRERVVKVSAKSLAGEEIVLSIEKGHWQKSAFVPDGVRIVSYPPEKEADVVVISGDVSDGTKGAALLLSPREYVIGIGCKSGKTEAEIGDFIWRKLKEYHIHTWQIAAAASVSQKRREAGIVSWCLKENISFITYTAKELQEVKGNFGESSFVKAAVGVGNVCERAAVKACGAGGRLIAKKYAENGMTIAIARKKWSVEFDEI